MPISQTLYLQENKSHFLKFNYSLLGKLEIIEIGSSVVTTEKRDSKI